MRRCRRRARSVAAAGTRIALRHRGRSQTHRRKRPILGDQPRRVRVDLRVQPRVRRAGIARVEQARPIDNRRGPRSAAVGRRYVKGLPWSRRKRGARPVTEDPPIPVCAGSPQGEHHGCAVQGGHGAATVERKCVGFPQPVGGLAPQAADRIRACQDFDDLPDKARLGGVGDANLQAQQRKPRLAHLGTLTGFGTARGVFERGRENLARDQDLTGRVPRADGIEVGAHTVRVAHNGARQSNRARGQLHVSPVPRGVVVAVCSHYIGRLLGGGIWKRWPCVGFHRRTRSGAGSDEQQRKTGRVNHAIPGIQLSVAHPPNSVQRIRAGWTTGDVGRSPSSPWQASVAWSTRQKRVRLWTLTELGGPAKAVGSASTHAARTRPEQRAPPMPYTVDPVAYVTAPRTTPEDDFWGGQVAEVTLTDAFEPAALQGIEAFSHVEILFLFHQVPDGRVVTGARHPRNNPAWPPVGIFAQRAKNRPNRLGSTICRVISVQGRTLRVSELDAIDGTPVLDIKPVMSEFLPRQPTVQPAWATELMERYWEEG